MFNNDGNGNRSSSAPTDVDEAMLPPVLEPSLDMVLDSDPVSDYMARVLDIVPDVEPDHLTALVVNAITVHGSGALERVLHVLFEDPKYPRAERKGKEKRKNPNDDNDYMQAQNPTKRSKLDYGYGDMNRVFMGGPDYASIALVR
jgi:E3 ubiquitin-protein ligase RNF216